MVVDEEVEGWEGRVGPKIGWDEIWIEELLEVDLWVGWRVAYFSVVDETTSESWEFKVFEDRFELTKLAWLSLDWFKAATVWTLGETLKQELNKINEVLNYFFKVCNFWNFYYL